MRKIGLGLFIAITAWSSTTLFRAALSNRKDRKEDMQFQFALLGVIAGIAIAVTTVYMGLQVKPVYFLIIGWAEATKQKSAVTATLRVASTSGRYRAFALGQVLK